MGDEEGYMIMVESLRERRGRPRDRERLSAKGARAEWRDHGNVRLTVLSRVLPRTSISSFPSTSTLRVPLRPSTYRESLPSCAEFHF